jgi:hypothetical protein
MTTRRFSKEKILILCILFFYIFATFPGKGGLEGDQREIHSLGDRIDNWGFMVPWLYGEWPNILVSWRFSLVIFQLCALWIGLYLLLKDNYTESGAFKIHVYLVIYLSTIFASQLWRDSSLFAFSVFGLGLLKFALSLTTKFRLWLELASLLILCFALMFKPVYGLIIGLFFVWIILQEIGPQRYFFIKAVPLVLFVTLTPFFADKALGSVVGLNRVYPEQQPIIFDLASNYCWGSSNKLVSDASKGVEIVLKPGFPIESVCGSLRPNSWDNLHSNPAQWQYSSPIFRITGENESKVRELEKRWITMIFQNPIDWIQTKFIYLGPTLIMSNAFTDQKPLEQNSNLFKLINYYSWKLITFPASFLDKTRMTSLGAALLLLLLLFFRNQKTHIHTLKTSVSSNIYISLFSILSTIAVTLLSFTANNGRYVMPYVLINYILLLRSKGLRSPIHV